MCRVILILFLLLWSSLVVAQKEVPATIETRDGQKKVGFARTRPREVNTTVVSFRENVNTTYIDYVPNDLKSFSLQEDAYESLSIDSTNYFLAVIVKGKASLYELNFELKKRYYLLKEGEVRPIWLRHEKIEIVIGDTKTTKMVSYYKTILKSKLNDCESLKSPEGVRPTLSGFQQYVNEYNKCFGTSDYLQKAEAKSIYASLMCGGVFNSYGSFPTFGLGLDFKSSRKLFGLTTLSFRSTHWQESQETIVTIGGGFGSNSSTIVIKEVRTYSMATLGYQVNMSLISGKTIEPYLSFEPAVMRWTEASKKTQGTLTASSSDSRFGFETWLGGGLKLRFSDKAFVRFAYTFPLFARADIGTLNIWLSYRIAQR